jgi:hypothetical protein
MAKIIDLNSKRPPSKNILLLLNFSNDVNLLLSKYLEKEVKPVELAGVLAIILGKFISKFTNKLKLFTFLAAKIKETAEIE